MIILLEANTLSSLSFSEFDTIIIFPLKTRPFFFTHTRYTMVIYIIVYALAILFTFCRDESEDIGK